MIVVVEPPTQLTRIPKWAGRSTLPRVWDDSCLERDCPAEDWPKCWLTPINKGPGRGTVPQTIIPDIRLKFDLWDLTRPGVSFDWWSAFYCINFRLEINLKCMHDEAESGGIKSQDVRQERRRGGLEIKYQNWDYHFNAGNQQPVKTERNAVMVLFWVLISPHNEVRVQWYTMVS